MSDAIQIDLWLGEKKSKISKDEQNFRLGRRGRVASGCVLRCGGT